MLSAILEFLGRAEAESDGALLNHLVPDVSEYTWTRILARVGGLRALLMLDDVALQQAVPNGAAGPLRAALELSKRFRAAADERPLLGSPSAIYRQVRPHLEHLPVERFLALSLDPKLALLGMDVVGEGSVDQCAVDPRHVFRAILRRSATGFVIAHNHPSGLATPSELDIRLTKQLVDGAAHIGVRLLDHIVVGAGTYTSMNDKGLLGERRSA
jgi:DNA repair protein RadC